MRLIKNIDMIRPDGKIVKVDIQCYTRNGSKSPELNIILYNSLRITPYEARVRGWKHTFNGLFHKIYSNDLNCIIYKKNPFLEMIKKDNYAKM